jgi:hypothetical protein
MDKIKAKKYKRPPQLSTSSFPAVLVALPYHDPASCHSFSFAIMLVDALSLGLVAALAASSPAGGVKIRSVKPDPPAPRSH